ncbi:MAG: type II toxin-antitoxin system prevent-host-death family antitoxin [Jannaschia sp.]
MQFSVHIAKTQLSKLIEAALRGEEVVIARGSRPVVRLVPLPQRRNLIGALEGEMTVPDNLFDPISEEELKLWEGG